MQKRKNLIGWVLMTALAGSLVFSLAKVFPQNYEPCNINNPNYCTECRDESKRDFAKCGEIDYRGVDFGLSKRIVFLKSKEYFGDRILGVDFDSYTKKVVYSANIGETSDKVEVFIAIGEINGDSLVIDDKTKKRVTWDAVGDRFLNFHPLWNKKREVIYRMFDGESGKSSYYTINQDGKNKKAISEEDYFIFLKECHNKNLEFICLSETK